VYDDGCLRAEQYVYVYQTNMYTISNSRKPRVKVHAKTKRRCVVIARAHRVRPTISHILTYRRMINLTAGLEPNLVKA
jgi:hypothetical protein